jgi:hypothetical protein
MPEEYHMKTIGIFALTMGMALILLGGCAQTYKEGSQTASSIQNVEQEAWVGKQQVNAAVAALDDMFNNQQGDLKEQFKTYSKSLDSLESQANRVKKRVDAMASQKSAYLQQWDAQMATIESEAVRQTTEQRRKSVEQMFDNVQQEMEAAGKVFDPFMKNLNDIRTAMNMDLNRNGLNAMRPVAEQAKADATIINDRLDAALAELSKAVKSLSAGGG